MLPRLTPKQRQRANALIKRLCANYDNGNCLALDDGEPCACVQSISYSLLCKYFRKAVLPAEPLWRSMLPTGQMGQLDLRELNLKMVRSTRSTV